MNLPRPLVTEKAFPEDEMVLDIGIDAEGNAAISNEIVYEKRLGPRGQLDVIVPFKFQKPEGDAWESGVGDIVAGYKHVLFSSLKSGSVFSLAGETVFATGDSDRDMGKGVTIFEGFAGYGQLLPHNSFLHFQSGIELPTDTDKANRAVFWRTVLGLHKAGFAPMVSHGRTPADRTGLERINWDTCRNFRLPLAGARYSVPT